MHNTRSFTSYSKTLNNCCYLFVHVHVHVCVCMCMLFVVVILMHLMLGVLFIVHPISLRLTPSPPIIPLPPSPAGTWRRSSACSSRVACGSTWARCCTTGRWTPRPTRTPATTSPSRYARTYVNMYACMCLYRPLACSVGR
jgi:hypothetical protein